jgi:hypothetical protein
MVTQAFEAILGLGQRDERNLRALSNANGSSKDYCQASACKQPRSGVHERSSRAYFALMETRNWQRLARGSHFFLIFLGTF